MKKNVQLAIKGFLTAYALTTEFHRPLEASHYETTLDFLIASVYEFLGGYNLMFLLIWVLSMAFYHLFENKVMQKKNTSYALAGFFSACLLLGRSYYETASWEYCFGSVVNGLKTLMAFVGFACLFYVVIAVAYEFFKQTKFVSEDSDKKSHFFSTKCFFKTFLVLAAVYGVVVLISYPGTLCWDTLGQIEQVTKGTGYSTHHPLLHTLIVGGLSQLGYTVFGSYDAGLFVYMLLQVVMLAAALAVTIAVLAKRGMKAKWLWGLLILYCIAPIYTNIVSVAIKDVPYNAFVIGYVICFALLLEKPERIKNVKFVLAFIAIQMGAILFRNNGLAMVLLSGIVAFVWLFKKYSWKERIGSLVALFGASIAVAKLITFVLMQLTSATEGSKGEMLSIPFQQTARYLQLYRDEISEEEKVAIETVLGPVDEIAKQYDPESSDPVKALHDKNATTEAWVNYLIAWAKGFFKHPVVYIEAFFAHIYGWFSPNVSNAIRYECVAEDFSQQGLFPGAQKLLIFFYRYTDRISVLGLLQKAGAYVWGLFFLAFYQRKEKKTAMAVANLPLWISLLVCMASPCFIYHPRYGLPILVTLPFLYGMSVTGKTILGTSASK